MESTHSVSLPIHSVHFVTLPNQLVITNSNFALPFAFFQKHLVPRKQHLAHLQTFRASLWLIGNSRHSSSHYSQTRQGPSQTSFVIGLHSVVNNI